MLLTSGARTYIDMPEQVTLGDEELVITRRANPRQPERYKYADIAQLVPLMDLPADPGGMRYAEFDPLIRQLITQEPFRPYVVELKTGERVEVARPAPRAGRFLKVWNPDGLLRSIEFHEIARLRTLVEAASA